MNMRRSTRIASGPRLRRSIGPLVLIAACTLASPALAGVRSQPATAKAVAGVLSQATGLAPSQVTPEAACPSAGPGFARCEAQALVLRSDHARVHPRVHGGPTFTQVFPRGRRRIASARPAVTGGGSQPSPGTPAWLQQAYDLTYLSQTQGSSDTVAIVDAYDDPTAQADLDVFRSTYGLPPCDGGCFQKVTQGGPTREDDAGWTMEESLDLDAVSAICPNCHIVLVEATDASVENLSAAVLMASELTPAPKQISNSWSATAASAIAGTYTFPGIAVLAATGDNGYVGVGQDNYPAALSGVTAVGGTSLAPVSGSARGFGESAWSLNGLWGASSGCDTSEPRPGYQPPGGCTGRAYADVSADADPVTGLNVYEDGSWGQVGGTSLASPLIAAYEAITGVDGATPKWAYDNSTLLNDPASGSSGDDCAPNILYICDAGPGYDGPTGIGSISGAVVAGAPGIGGPSFGGTYTEALGVTSATLSGGVYPNGLDTTCYWQYGPTTAYGSQTQGGDIGAGPAPAMATVPVSGLAPGTTYHYRLVAQNSYGTTYGYDSQMTTLRPPLNTVLPAVGGTALPGQTLYAYSGNWTTAGGSFSYQWQRWAGGGAWTNIAAATGSTYTLGAADAGDYVRVVVTATNLAGQSSAASAAFGPVASPAIAAPRWKGLPQISADPGRVGDTVKVTRGTWTGSPLRSDVVRVMRCANTCVAVGPSNLTRYTIDPADIGSSLWIRETATSAGGSATVWSARSVGSVVSVSSAAVVLSTGQTALRNSRGATLAIASIGSVSATADAGRARPGSRVLELRRARGVSGSVTGWVCSVAGVLGGPPPECTARIALGAHASVRLPGSIRGRVRIVVVRQGP